MSCKILWVTSQKQPSSLGEASAWWDGDGADEVGVDGVAGLVGVEGGVETGAGVGAGASAGAGAGAACNCSD